MDFDLSKEQALFRSTIRDFVDREIRPVAREWEQQGRYPTEIVDSMKEMGLFGITVPEEFGGTALDLVSFSIVFEEISRGRHLWRARYRSSTQPSTSARCSIPASSSSRRGRRQTWLLGG